jgi:hypothetical protein
MPSIKLVKKAGLKAGRVMTVRDPISGDFILVDNGNQSFTVQGVDAAGNPVDLTTTFTLAVSSSNTTLVTVGSVTGMTFSLVAVGPLSVPGSPVMVTVVATGIPPVTAGPFTATLAVDVVAGGATGIQIVPNPTSITITT